MRRRNQIGKSVRQQRFKRRTGFDAGVPVFGFLVKRPAVFIRRDVDLDEDEYMRFLSSSEKMCPYYRNGDEYEVVKHQNWFFKNAAQPLSDIKITARSLQAFCTCKLRVSFLNFVY